MNLRRAMVLIFPLLAAALLASCDRSAGLKGQSNSVITFHALAVDENGVPLQGASFTIEVEAIPPGWTFETRGKPHVLSTISAASGADGRFQPQIAGHVLRIKEASRSGYRHLFDLQQGRSLPGENMFYQLDAWSDPWFKSDPVHPAVFVFVKDGAKEVSALPCKGGYDSSGGKQWRLNKPGWPREPSLKDVVYKKPTTAP